MTILATMMTLAALLAVGAPTPQETPPPAERQSTRVIRVLDVNPVLEGEDAPGIELVREAVAVELGRSDLEASVVTGNRTGELLILAEPEDHERIGRLVTRMALRPPTGRIEAEMLYLDLPQSRDGIGRFYFGREIAKVMGHLGATWLERPSREKEERTSLLMDMLGIEEDSDVADIGAGTGYFTFPIARRAGNGTVYAVDIQPEMLEFIEARKRTEKIENVIGVLGGITDTRLPEESIDIAFAVDAYHEFSNPWEMLQSIRTALRPGGRLILVEFRLEDPDVPIKLLHKMSERQARREVEAAGFTWVRTGSELPRQHVLVFEKPGPDPEHVPAEEIESKE